MILLTLKPRIITLNERKIHVCRKPGFIAWFLLNLSTIIFIRISWQLTHNPVYTIVLLLGQIMFILDAFGEWQELLLDKDENRVIIKRHNWIDRLYLKVAYESWCISMKLSDVRYVGVSVQMGLFILEKSGETRCLSMQGLTRKELQQLRKQIKCFLTSKSK